MRVWHKKKWRNTFYLEWTLWKHYYENKKSGWLDKLNICKQDLVNFQHTEVYIFQRVSPIITGPCMVCIHHSGQTSLYLYSVLSNEQSDDTSNFKVVCKLKVKSETLTENGLGPTIGYMNHHYYSHTYVC